PKHGVRHAPGLASLVLVESVPGEIEEILPPSEHPLAVELLVEVGLVPARGFDRVDVEILAAPARLASPMRAHEIPNRHLEKVAKAAAARVGAGEFAAQDANDDLLREVLGVVLVSDDRAHVREEIGRAACRER